MLPCNSVSRGASDLRARVPGTLVLSGDERTEKKDLTKNTSEQLRLRCTVEYNGEPKRKLLTLPL
jgi:hypothetical protein